MKEDELARRVADAIAQLPADTDLAVVTMRQVKAAVQAAACLSDAEWADVVAEHKAFLKEEASRQLDLALASAKSTGPTSQQRSTDVGAGAAKAKPSKPKGTPREGKRARGNAGGAPAGEPVVPKHTKKKKKTEATCTHGNKCLYVMCVP